MPNRNSEIPIDLAGTRSGSTAYAHHDRTFSEPREPAHSVPLPLHWVTTAGSGTAGACSNSRSPPDYEFAIDRGSHNGIPAMPETTAH
jgi:hypothetical protein